MIKGVIYLLLIKEKGREKGSPKLINGRRKEIQQRRYFSAVHA